MNERTIEEVITDRVLLLYLIDVTRQKGYNISGDVKLQKLLYMTEERMYSDRYKGLNYSFVRWEHGVFSPEIYLDTSDLVETGLLTKDESRKTVDITEKGHSLLEALRGLLDRNRKFKNFIERVVNEFGSYSGKNIRTAMYSYPKVGEKKLLRDVRKGEIVLQKVDNSEANDRFWIDEKWFETLKILFDPVLYKSIKEGLKALKEEEGKPFIPTLE